MNEKNRQFFESNLTDPTLTRPVDKLHFSVGAAGIPPQRVVDVSLVLARNGGTLGCGSCCDREASQRCFADDE